MPKNFGETLWSGNAEEVFNACFSLLKGKQYVFVAVNTTNAHSRIQVRPDQELTLDRSGYINDWYVDETHAGFHFCDTYGGWGLTTSKREPGYDDTYQAPYIEINFREEWINIWQVNGYGEVLKWSIVVQNKS